MYGLGNRDEYTEIKARYEAMVNFMSDMFNCGRWDIEDMVDSNNNIEVGEIVKRWVGKFGTLPTNNDIYREALLDFASEHNLEFGTDVDIYTNNCLDTHIYYREGLDEDIIKQMEELYGMDANEMA